VSVDAVAHLVVEGLGGGDHQGRAAGLRRRLFGLLLGEGALARTGAAED